MIPDARSLDDIMKDAELIDEREGAVVFAVALIRDLGSTTRINVSLDFSLLRSIDEAAAARKQTLSAFLASAARRELVE